MITNNLSMRYRAWDKYVGKWLFGYEYPNLGGFSIMGEVVAFGELTSYSIEYWEHIIITQYTGLKDKNGLDVYEGDILEYANEFGRYHIHNVYYKEGGLVINTHNDDLGKDTPFYSACADMQTAQWIKQCTVIGNIFENSELLEVKRV